MTTPARPGQPLALRADDWNDANAAGQAHANARRSQGLEIVDPRTRAPDLIRIRNATEDQFDQYDVVELTAPVIAPADSARGWKDGIPAMDAVTPTSPAAAIRGKLAILAEPIGPGKTRVAIASAVCRTRLTLCDASHTHAAPIAGSRRLQSTADTGAPIEILWADEPAEPEGEEEQDLTVDALVRISNAHEPLTAFKLTARAESLDDFPKAATRIDADGTPYGDPIDVRTPLILERIYGPADIGFQGWAVYKSAEYQEGDPCEAGHWQIVHMQRFARYIQFSGAKFSNGCLVPAEAAAFWDGEAPVWGIKVDASHLLCACLGTNATGIAVLDEKQSEYPWLIYRVVDIDQLLYTADAADCESNPCASGQATRVLIAGDGLSLEYLQCGANPCAAVLHWDGLLAVGMECAAETVPTEGGFHVQKIAVAAPLTLTTEGDCPTTAKIGLASGLIEADNTDECVTVTVTESQCKFKIAVALDRECLRDLASIIVLPGECIAVDEGEDENGKKTYTVHNTMQVVGGNGIRVARQGCTYSVSLDSSVADPKTTLRFLCGVELSPIQISCVQDYEGNWGFSVSGGELTEHFTEVTLPAAVVEALTSDCEGGYEDPDPPPDPPPKECTDCPDCEAGYKKVMQIGTGTCNCVAEGVTVPDGWIDCSAAEPPTDPPGSGLEFTGISCDGDPPHWSYIFRGFPTGAVGYEVHVIGDQGSNAVIGWATNPIVGQEYWGALDDEFGPPQPGENFVFEVIFKDADGFGVATQFFTASCPS